MVEIPFCVFLRMKMHTKIHFIRKNAAKKLAEIRQWPILYVNLRRQMRKNDFWGSPGPSTRGGRQKRPKRVLGAN